MNVMDLLRSFEERERLPAGYLARIRSIESANGQNTFNPKSGAAGDFQFIPSTARQYGLKDPYDLNQSADAAARFTRDNANYLQKALGREPTAAELYLAHQQGAGGAVKLLSNPDSPAGELVGSKAIAWNGGDPNASASEFANKWLAKFDGTQIPNGSTEVPAKTQTAAPPSDTMKIAGYDVSRSGIASLLDGLEQMGSSGRKQQQQTAMAPPVLSANDGVSSPLTLLPEQYRRRMITGLI